MILDQTGLIEITSILSFTVLLLTALIIYFGGNFSIRRDKNGGSMEIKGSRIPTDKTNDCLPNKENSHSSNINND